MSAGVVIMVAGVVTMASDAVVEAAGVGSVYVNIVAAGVLRVCPQVWRLWVPLV